MKVINIIFVMVFAPVLYKAYIVFSQSLGTELAIMLTAWLLLIIPVLWFTCERRCKFKILPKHRFIESPK
jgi:hypothetical protein